MDLERIGKYKILEEIGHGTMGKVYKAHDPVLNRLVAIKTLSVTVGVSDEMHKRFHREAQAAALLSHPSIVTVHDFGDEQGLIFMAMELLEGIDLRTAIGEGRLPGLDEKLRIMEQVCAGLAFAHSKGVVHRDLKPANIHIQPSGQIKIVDFGLARLNTSEITQDGVVLGTPNYMSPEQALGDKVDARSDIFSAGAVFYELLTGHRPFVADSTPGVLYQVVHKQPRAVRQWAPDVPPILVEVVEKALIKDKNLRFQNARQMRAALGVARQALDAGRGPDATLAEESQRALREATRKERLVRHLGPFSPGSPPPFVEGTVALDVTPPEAPLRGARKPALPETLSSRAPTEVDHSRRQSGKARPAPPPRRWLRVTGGLAVAGLAVAGVFWMRTEPLAPAGPPPLDPARAQVSALTRALVETQLQLARRDLDDKRYTSAIGQAERVLKLDGRNVEAGQLLEKARARRDELDAAAREARRALEAGDTQKASQALSRVLDLDPKHPVVDELTARLNGVFRSRAEEAGRSLGRSRLEAERGGAGSSEAFVQAAALAREAEARFQKGDYADATRGLLESRDAFDRARRALNAPTPSAPQARSAGTSADAAPVPAPTPAVAPPSAPPAPELATLLPAPGRRFVAGKTTIATAKAGGGLEGFDTADVRTQRMPELVGRIEFDITPPPVKSGDAFTVRLYLVNEGKKTVRIKGVTLTATVNGRRGSGSGTSVSKDVAPLQRVLLAELPGVWPEGVASWSLEAVVTSDRDETGTSRLSWM